MWQGATILDGREVATIGDLQAAAQRQQDDDRDEQTAPTCRVIRPFRRVRPHRQGGERQEQQHEHDGNQFHGLNKKHVPCRHPAFRTQMTSADIRAGERL